MPQIRYSFVDSLTGRRELVVYPSDGSWRSKVNGVDGARTHEFMVRDRMMPISRDMWARILQPWRMRFVAEWNGLPKYAGWVLGHDWDAKTGRLLLAHADFRSVAARRALFGVGPLDLPDIVIEGRSLRGLMGEYAWRALVDGGYRWALRLVVDPADRFEPGAENVSIRRSRLDTLESLMRDLHSREGGPEAHFFPRWSPVDGGLEDVLRIGTPKLQGDTITVHASAEHSPVTGFGYKLVGENQLTGVWGTAQGRGQDTKVGLALNTAGSDIPFLDKPFSIKATQEQSVADSQAGEHLRLFREPVKQYRLQIADAELNARTEIGTNIAAYYMGDELEPPGWINGRVIALSHAVRDQSLTLEVQ
ncbi:hypothetical protein [Microbacterium testaceum]|uniref:Uncharacterized protein n=1 Tax=Microbacterium testaceum TaxID=2033 RepID=A0A147F4W5_MICTE|nr:hypothetical protein [Microbacterium testaceum]KTS09034.1 hypothetical protein RSA3_14115 [Microbacterium testaceum]